MSGRRLAHEGQRAFLATQHAVELRRGERELAFIAGANDGGVWRLEVGAAIAMRRQTAACRQKAHHTKTLFPGFFGGGPPIRGFFWKIILVLVGSFGSSHSSRSSLEWSRNLTCLLRTTSGVFFCVEISKGKSANLFVVGIMVVGNVDSGRNQTFFGRPLVMLADASA